LHTVVFFCYILIIFMTSATDHRKDLHSTQVPYEMRSCQLLWAQCRREANKFWLFSRASQ
jgi:hypothetical protein